MSLSGRATDAQCFRVWSATLYCGGTSFLFFGIRNRWSSWLPGGDRRKSYDNRLTAHSEERGAVTRGITRVLSLKWMVLEVYPKTMTLDL